MTALVCRPMRFEFYSLLISAVVAIPSCKAAPDGQFGSTSSGFSDISVVVTNRFEIEDVNSISSNKRTAQTPIVVRPNFDLGKGAFKVQRVPRESSRKQGGRTKQSGFVLIVVPE